MLRGFGPKNLLLPNSPVSASASLSDFSKGLREVCWMLLIVAALQCALFLKILLE